MSRPDQQVREAFEERAVGLLRKALRLKPAEECDSFWREDIQNNATLASIRNSRDFARLAAEYGRKK